MARTWLSIHVELIEGGGRILWPRPGRVFAAARSHTFAALADAIDTAFARWDRSHLCLFELADGTQVSGPIRWEDPSEDMVFAGDVRLSRLSGGEQLLYTFDMGDDWTHLCTVAEQRVDPLQELGIVPDAPLAYWGWGEIPDQYGRRTSDDDGESPLAPDPELTDLPPLRPFWGRRHDMPRQPERVELQDVEEELLAGRGRARAARPAIGFGHGDAHLLRGAGAAGRPACADTQAPLRCATTSRTSVQPPRPF